MQAGSQLGDQGPESPRDARPVGGRCTCRGEGYIMEASEAWQEGPLESTAAYSLDSAAYRLEYRQGGGRLEQALSLQLPRIDIAAGMAVLIRLECCCSVRQSA